MFLKDRREAKRTGKNVIKRTSGGNIPTAKKVGVWSARADDKIKIERWADQYRNSRSGIFFSFKISRLIKLLLLLAGSAAMFVLCSYLFYTPATEDSPALIHYVRIPVVVFLLGIIGVLIFCRINISPSAQGNIRLLVMVFHPIICMVAAEWINSTYIIVGATPVAKWFVNYVCYFFVLILFFAIFRNVYRAATATTIVSLVFAAANYFTVQFRGVPVLPWDFSALGTAADVAGNYDFVITMPLLLSILLAIIYTMLMGRFIPKGSEVSTLRVVVERGSAALAAILLFVLIVPVNFMTYLGLDVWPWDQATSLKLIGVAANFTGNLQYVMIEKPEGYSEEKISEIAEVAKEQPSDMLGNPEKEPTIIVIMNESFTDMEAVSRGNIELTQDALPYIRTVLEDENSISGTAYSSVFGGNTCDSEFEFLTGNSTSFLPPGSKAYQQYVRSKQTSLVRILKENYGYETIAIHPGTETAWNRNTAYDYLGFDKFVYSGIFSAEKTTEHKIISDKTAYDQLIYEYENYKESDPLFLFNVTIQNHGGFEDKEFKTTVQVKDHEGEFPQAEQYLSLIKKSDESFEEMFEYFKKVEEPVIFVFFGDHWPKLEDEFTELLLGVDDLERLGAEDMMKRYEVPFFIWANYELETAKDEITSLNFLPDMLLRASGMESSAFLKFTRSFSETLPVFTDIGMIDAEGNAYRQGDKTPYSEIINNYAILQYNQLFDEEKKDNLLFYAEKLEEKKKLDKKLEKKSATSSKTEGDVASKLSSETGSAIESSAPNGETSGENRGK